MRVFIGVFIKLIESFIYGIGPLQDTRQQGRYSGRPEASECLTSKNMKAFPSPASGAKAMKLAISSFEGNMAGRVRYPIESSQEVRTSRLVWSLNVCYVDSRQRFVRRQLRRAYRINWCIQ